MLRIGVDTGGTFTDFVFFDGKNIKILKLPSTPENPANSIQGGLDSVGGSPFELVHGTTVATNSFLQKKMARAAFVATRGFEHMLVIGRQNRTNLFSFQVKKPFQLIPLSRCYGLEERTLADGTLLKPVVTSGLSKLIGRMKKQGIVTIGIVFLHSYQNPENENKVAEIFRNHGFQVTASSEIMPEYREYERAVITILNSSLKPIIATYVNELKSRIKRNRFYIMQSNGGVLPPERIIDEPVRTIMSGPAGGVIAARRFSGLTRNPNIITLDMGGTSTDVSIIKSGQLLLTRDGYLENLPMRIPIIDIATVGAGGGSIAKIDRGGVLQVGPESAGADPGPACYGKSQLPTVTDAFVVNGIIQPELFLGGNMKISLQKSIQAVTKIASSVGKTLHETAEGIILISVSAIEKALRSVTLEKGEDPRFYTLLPFGGAGGMVATLLAERLGINRILIPPYQGVFSALGMLVADFQKEFSHSFLKPFGPGISREIEKVFSKIIRKANRVLTQDGFSEENSVIQRELDIRYRGQSFELTVPFGPDFIQDFHRKHDRLYSYRLDDPDCEIVNLRVLALGRTSEISIRKKKKQSGQAPLLDKKRIYFNGNFQSFYVYPRETIQPGQDIRVPAIVVSDTSTVVVERNFEVRVDEYTNLILTRKGVAG
jgi:N-methylhydantoinase A